MKETFVGMICKCPKCGSKDIWMRWTKEHTSVIRCAGCGFSEGDEVNE